MTYDQTIEFLYSQTPQFQQIGAAAYKPGLGTVIALSEKFGNPHLSLRCIHIGGTNGKGSTAHSLASVLQAAGYKVGLFTSPHLLDFRERMRINGNMIPREEVTGFVERCRECDALAAKPSFFELTTVMAFDWFAREKVDVAVIEVGLGGRLDSTNIITPELSVITNISLDHVAQLGDTLPQIASEKAGIIKPGVPAVVGEADGNVREVFERKAAEVGAPVRFACDGGIFTSGGEPQFTKTAQGERLTAVTRTFGPVEFELTGDCQQRNLATITCALELLKESFGITPDAVRKGLALVNESTGLAGRWMTLSQTPLIICDTGHNIGGWEWLAPRLASHKGKLIMVIGFVNDKDTSHILPLMPHDAEYIFTRASVPRALPAEELALRAESAGLRGRTAPDVETALVMAREAAGAEPDAMIFVGGSTFIVADALRCF